MEEMDKNLKYWQDKYTRLLEGHHKLQSVNQLLEEKLMNYAAKCAINETQPTMNNKPALECPQEERTQLQMADPILQQSGDQQQNQIDTQRQPQEQLLLQPSQQKPTHQPQQQQLEEQQLQQQPQQQQPQEQQPQQATVSLQSTTTQEQLASGALTKVKIYDELNIFDWFKSSGILDQIAEKATRARDSIVTALDPGMKSHLFTGGSIKILVINGKESLFAPTQEAFQEVFGRATIEKSSVKQLPEKVTTGLEQAITISLERIKSIREDKNSIPQNQVILDIQPTLTNCISQDFPGLVHDKSNIGLENDENSQLSKWFYTYSMILDDPVLGTYMNSFSQPVPVDLDCVNKINSVCVNEIKLDDQSLDDKNVHSITIDEIMIERLNLATEDDWIEQWTGISTHSIIYNLGKCMAHLYKRKWQQFTEND